MDLKEPEYGLFPLVLKNENGGIPAYGSLESSVHDRKYWINRKADRITMSCSYMQTGLSRNNKQWFKWKQLFSITLTVKKPAYKKGKNSVNLFFNGISGTRFYRGAINITRHPHMFAENLPQGFLFKFMAECISLAVHQNLITKEEAVQASAHIQRMYADGEELPVIVEELINYIAFPVLKTQFSKAGKQFAFKRTLEDGGLPVFTTKYLREVNVESVAASLKLGTNASKMFVENAGTLKPECIYILDLIRGYATDETQVKIIKDFILSPKNTFFNGANSNWDVIGEPRTNIYTENIRQILKLVERPQLQKLILSDNFLGSMERFLMRWVGLSPFEKKFFIKGELKDMNDFYDKFVAEIRNKKTTRTVTQKDIETFFEEFTDDKFIINRNARVHKIIEIHFPRYRSHLPINTKDGMDMSGYATGFSKHDILKSSTIWTEVFSDATFVKNQKDINGFDGGRNIYPNYVFSAESYLKFLNLAKDEALRYLVKHKMELNVSNKAYAFMLVVLSVTDRSFHKFNGKLPSKLFKMKRDNLHPEIIEHVFRKNIPYSKVADMGGLPKQWVEKLLDIEVNINFNDPF